MELYAYRGRIAAGNDRIYIEKITAQIDANAVICTDKYDRYNDDLKFSVRGVVRVFVLLVIIPVPNE